MHALTAE